LYFPGVATTEEVAVAYHRIDELKGKLKAMMKQEISMYKAVAEVQATADTVDSAKREIAKLRVATTMDANYQSRKGRRLLPPPPPPHPLSSAVSSAFSTPRAILTSRDFLYVASAVS
jgi:hypothetical protein